MWQRQMFMWMEKVFLADPHENGWVHCNPKIICEEKKAESIRSGYRLLRG